MTGSRLRSGGNPSRPTLALLLGAALLLAPSPAGARFDPAHRWSTRATPHFEILFHEGEEDLSARVAAIAEEVHGALAPRIGRAPETPTRLILADDLDYAAGWASPYPFSQIFISPSPPGGESGLGGASLEDWLRLVITHEYTHALQLDLVTGGAPRAVDAVFGRLWFPNALQPIWLIEGLAVYEETELAPGGRGRLPAAEMVLRMAALEGRIPTLAEMAVFPDAWPAGRVPYLFGESFIRFLAGRHGRERIAALSLENAQRNLPWLIESTGRRALGEEYRDLWGQWSAELRARYRGEQAALEREGLTPFRRLTDGGWTSLSPAWSPDGGRIAWLAAGEQATPGVWVMDAAGGGRRRLVAAPFASPGLSWSRGGERLFYARVDLRRDALARSDIRAWDFALGREVEITRGLRARDPDVSPDGAGLLAVTVGGGRSRLVVVPLEGELPVTDPERLRGIEVPGVEQYERPRWSPDGRRIAVGIRRGDGTSGVAILSGEGSLLAELPAGSAFAGAPAWSPDGALVFLATDRTGIFNLAAWDPVGGGVRQVTSVLGGAFSPAPSPDGLRIAFSGYGPGGFDVGILDLDPSSWRALAFPAAIATLPAEEPAPPTPTGPVAPYRPLDTLLPRLWVPWLSSSPESGTLAGFLTGGQDLAQRHRFLAGALAATSGDRLSWLFDYAYGGFLPTLRFSASDADVVHDDLLRIRGRRRDYIERQRLAGLEAAFPLGSLEAPRTLTVGYRYRGLSALSELPPPGQDDRPVRGRLGSTRLGWALDARERPAAAISAERGRRVALGIERFQEGLGSELSFTRATADWAEYLPLPPEHHALQARLFLGASSGDRPAQGAFRLGGDVPGDVSYGLDDEALHLRGYPPNTARGDRALLASLEYRFPLLPLGRGGVSAPVYLRRVHGALFAEGGAAWTGELKSGQLRRSAGAEVRLDLYFSYAIPATVRAGIAYGFDRDGGVRPVAGLWLSLGTGGAVAQPGRR